MSEVSLWILIGLPGSGKSTWAQQFVNINQPLMLVSTDQIRAQLYGDAIIQGEWLQIWSEVKQNFRRGSWATQKGDFAGVLYDATNTRRKSRREVIQAARTVGFTRLLAVWLDTPLVCCLHRNAQRSRQVPAEVICAMARQLAGAPPHCNEGFDVLFRQH
ncbi:MAG: AAA family ATPase [Cyanobacteria bacterium J06639_14]